MSQSMSSLLKLSKHSAAMVTRHNTSPLFLSSFLTPQHSVSILLQALKGVGNREEGKKGGGFHSIPFPFPLFRTFLPPPPLPFLRLPRRLNTTCKAVGNSSYRTRLFCICNHMTRRPCWGSIQHNFFLKEFT